MFRAVSLLSLLLALSPLGCGGAGADQSCFSPTQNLDTAHGDGGFGCPCPTERDSICLPDSKGRNVALVCDGVWKVIEGGACRPPRSK